MTLTLKFDLLIKTFKPLTLQVGQKKGLSYFYMAGVFLVTKPFSPYTINFYLVTWTLKFDLLFKNLNHGHNLNLKRKGFHYSHVYSF